MSETPLHGPQPIKALIGDLADDARGYARAETAYLRAQVSERTRYAKPAIFMIGGGVALVLGSLLALPFGLMVVLSPLLTPAGAVAAVTLGLILIGGMLVWAGTRRIKAAFKRPEDR
jgi:Putative Actinobacterial Holin-X, holin superfamily III